MTFSEYNSHTNPLFLELKLLKLRDIIKLQQLQLVYDFNNDLLPHDLKHLCPLIWNKLIKNNIPIDNKLENNIKIENIKSKNIFKQVLKKRFFYTLD